MVCVAAENDASGIVDVNGEISQHRRLTRGIWDFEWMRLEQFVDGEREVGRRYRERAPWH